MATHSSVLAWRIPGTAEPGGLPMESHRVGHDWSDLAAAYLNVFLGDKRAKKKNVYFLYCLNTVLAENISAFIHVLIVNDVLSTEIYTPFKY